MSAHNIYGELTTIILQLPSNTYIICSIGRFFQELTLTQGSTDSIDKGCGASCPGRFMLPSAQNFKENR